ncbi:UNKNOWN [Stylonychia lemnae]|uniref:Uncharacterized protein n=1 Tax=Stylonychia lemnae TaxID=5949 RepID=A0A077ZX12_STYLE|nr:UNKNOWN [Stylonychia lemnae]|eukprot:CDW73051.1 UNKNOWN [Stylonychia lemnae]
MSKHQSQQSDKDDKSDQNIYGDFDIDKLISQKKKDSQKRHKGVSLKQVESQYKNSTLIQEDASDDPMSKAIGLISAGGKAPQFQYSTLGKFEIRDKKLYVLTFMIYIFYSEEFLVTNIPVNKGKSDYEIELERKRKELEEARLRIMEEQMNLYKIPQHLDVDKISKDRRLIDQTNWVNGLIEVPIAQDKKIQNVEEAEKLRLQQLKKIFVTKDDEVEDQSKQSNQKNQKPKKNELQKLVEFEKNNLRKNRDKINEIEQKRETNRQIERHQND